MLVSSAISVSTAASPPLPMMSLPCAASNHVELQNDWAVDHRSTQKTRLASPDLPLQVESGKLASHFIRPFESDEVINTTAVGLSADSFIIHPPTVLTPVTSSPLLIRKLMNA